MVGEIVGDKVIVDDKPISFEEALYLIENRKIQVFEGGKELDSREFLKIGSDVHRDFEVRYIVYRDLRRRGYHIRVYSSQTFDFGLYSRGGGPGKTQSEYLVHIFSERTSVALEDMLRMIHASDNVRRKMMMAIVDEEGDITFYGVKRIEFKGDEEYLPKRKVNASLLHDRVIVWDHEASVELNENGFFGRLVDERLQLSLVESEYLIKKGNIEVFDLNGSQLDFNSFLKVAKQIEKDFIMKYRIYEDLREKGMVVKTGFKFGSHFRVYDDISSHSKYLVHAIPYDHVFLLPEVSRAIRLAHGVRKRMVFAFNTDHAEYIDVGRLKP